MSIEPNMPPFAQGFKADVEKALEEFWAAIAAAPNQRVPVSVGQRVYDSHVTYRIKFLTGDHPWSDAFSIDDRNLWVGEREWLKEEWRWFAAQVRYVQKHTDGQLTTKSL